MKNVLGILMLCLIASACTTQGPAVSETSSLLSFQEISAEITVTHEALEDELVRDEIVASTAAE